MSPALHRAAYAELGLDWTYDAHRVAAGELPAFVGSLDASWRGLSLTMPLKREAVELASGISPVARLAGAANTLLLVDGSLHADNTDVPLDEFDDDLPREPRDATRLAELAAAYGVQGSVERMRKAITTALG